MNHAGWDSERCQQSQSGTGNLPEVNFVAMSIGSAASCG